MSIAKQVGTALLSIAAPANVAHAGTVFTEDWSGATPGLVTIPGGTVTTNAHTWTTSDDLDSGTAAPEMSIINDGGNLLLENTAEGDDKDNQAIFTVSGLAAMDPAKATTIQFDIQDLNDAGTSQQRWYLLLEDAATEDGYRVRVSTENNDEEVLNASIFDDGSEAGDEKWDELNNGAGEMGVPGAGAWRATVTFIRKGADTEVRYRLDGLNGSPDLVAPNVSTFTGATAQSSFNRVSLFCRRPLASIDNLVISQDTDAPVITLLGDATVNLDCGDSYVDAGAAAFDTLEGDLSADLVVDNPVNTNVAGSYTVTYNVSDASGNAAAVVTRTVNVAACPSIVITPIGNLNQTIEVGSATPATFEVSATGSGTLTYQWFYDNGAKSPVAISGAESASYTILSPQESDSGTYYVQVTDNLDTAQSPDFTLNVVAALPASSGLGLVLMSFFAAICGATLLRERESR